MRYYNITTKWARHYPIHNITNTTLYRGILHYYSIIMSIIQPKTGLSGLQAWDLTTTSNVIDLITVAAAAEAFASDKVKYHFNVTLDEHWNGNINIDTAALPAAVKKTATFNIELMDWGYDVWNIAVNFIDEAGSAKSYTLMSGGDVLELCVMADGTGVGPWEFTGE